MPIVRLLPILALSMLAGCAATGSYPSLAPRALERDLTGGSVPAGCPVPADPAAALGAGDADAEPALASDPALRTRVAEMVTAARAGQAAFAALLPAIERQVARAGSPQSEAWIEAQQGLSQLEAARGRTADALAELDSLAIRPAAGPGIEAGDYAAILAASDEIRALAGAQDAAMDRLSAQLPAPAQ